VVGDVGGLRGGAGRLLPLMDYAIASESCARQLSADGDWERACRAVRQRGPRCVVVTLGEKGLVCLEGDRFSRMPAFAVNVLDTTGAGDVFHGAFCYGLVQGFALERNLAFASAAAAMKCRRLGGRAGIPTRQEVEEFLRRHGDGSS
jgi:sugar/nucleoside kinase (ribokinase family)